MATIDPVAEQFARAVVGAMARPGVEAVAYSEVDKAAVAAEARKLRGKSNRLLDLIGGGRRPLDTIEDGTLEGASGDD